MSLAGKTVVITGSTYGIGLATARACGAAGARVVVSSRRETAVRQTMTALQAERIEATGLACDVRDAEALHALFGHAIEAFGRIDVWVNNAGLGGGLRQLEAMSEADIRDIVDVNVTGTMLACKLMIPYFREHGGIILNLGGRGSDLSTAPFGAAYAATKVAVTSLTKSLAEENEDAPVSIHEIRPGMVRTGFFEDLDTSDELRGSTGTIDLVLDAIGMSPEEIGSLVAEVAAQTPGEKTGRTYNAFRGIRKITGVARLARLGMTGKLQKAQRT